MDPIIYKNAKSNYAIEDISKLFSDMNKNEHVEANIMKGGKSISYDWVTHIHNYLHSSKSWVKVQDWSEEVEYTIPHPYGDIYAYDTKHDNGTRLRRLEKMDPSFTGESSDGMSSVDLSRVIEKDVGGIDFNSTRYSWVKVMNVKRFFYETERSSFVYRIVVKWEGETKDIAKASQVQFNVYLQTNDHVKSKKSPLRSCVSFMEKVLDLLADTKTRHCLTIKTDACNYMDDA